MSKINTETLIEEGRYIVRPDSAGNPSRTSVSLSGNVAVANRSGGVVKIYGNTDACQESNGMAGIQTSTGAADMLPWGTEECVAWYTSFAYSTQRPLAWAQGEWNDATCSYQNEKLWTSGGNNAGTADVVLIDGDTGVVEDMVTIPNVIGWAQLYGGAVDGDGNFWTVDHNWDGPSTLIRVMRNDLSYETWPVTGTVHYGLAVDSVGRAWLCGSGGASRFDPGTETWTHLPPMNGGSALGGCMEDANGILWNSAYPNATLVGIDTESVQVVTTMAIPEYVHGISIDFAGYVWGVAFAGSNAYRIDVDAGTIDTVGGLVGAYTYSDMTGFALTAAWIGFAACRGLWSHVAFVQAFIVVQAWITAWLYAATHAVLMDATGARIRATQFAVLTACLNLPRVWAPALGAWAVAALGFAGTFAACGVWQAVLALVAASLGVGRDSGQARGR